MTVLTEEVLVPTKTVVIYEITGPDGIAIWGGDDPNDAMYWYRKKSPSNSRVFAESFDEDEDGEEAWPNGERIDITPIVVAAIASGS